MNAPAFVLAAAAPARAVLSARPWVCGRPLVASLPVYKPAFLRACAAAEDAVPQDPKDKPVEPVAEAAPVDASGDDAEDVENTAADSTDEGVNADESTKKVTTAEKAGGERKRRRRTRAKREVTLPLEDMTIGMELEGTVKSVTGYGAFVGEMGTPTDGLLHVSQLRSGFVENVSDVVAVGDKIKARVLAIDLEKGNFSLTMKSAEELSSSNEGRRRSENKGNRKEELNKKWSDFSFDPQVTFNAKVTTITDFGAFCKLLGEDGEPMESVPTEGLIHISEVSAGRVESVESVLSIDQVVKVRIISADRKRNRISLSMKEYKEESEEQSDDGKSDFSKDIEAATRNQPEFKSTMELAFERAQAKAAAKEAAAARKE